MDALAPRGHCDERFAALREAFAGNFTDHDKLGAAVHLRVDGRPVVDLCGGGIISAAIAGVRCLDS